MEQMNGSVVCNFSCARFLYEPESCNATHIHLQTAVFIHGLHRVAHQHQIYGLHFVAAAVHFDAAICTQLVSVQYI